MTITYRAEYSGHVDGERVAHTYRAFNEEGSPYVVVLDDGTTLPLTLIQAPLEFLDGVADEDSDLENAQAWVHRLTELVHKARAYDEIFDDIEDAVNEPRTYPSMCGLPPGGYFGPAGGFHDLHVVEEDDDYVDDCPCDNSICELPLTVEARTWLPSDAYTVEALTDAEIDQEWVDVAGDHYKNINGDWFLSVLGGTSPWKPMKVKSLLANCGPYTVVGK